MPIMRRDGPSSGLQKGRPRAFQVIGLLLAGVVSLAEGATDHWLITPQEAALAAAEESLIQSRGLTTSGPGLDVVKPVEGSDAPSPVDILVRFIPREDPVDPNSLKVSLIKLIAVDLTDRVRPYAGPSGIDMKGAKIPPGSYRVRISVADVRGAVSARDLSFEVR